MNKLPASPHWHAEKRQAALDRLHSNLSCGLTTATAEQRRSEYGPNQLAEKAPRPAWLKFVDQFRSFLVVVLLGTAVATADLPPPTSLQRAAAETTTLPPRPLQVTFVGDRLAASLDGHADVGGGSPMRATILNAPDCGLATGGWVRRLRERPARP